MTEALGWTLVHFLWQGTALGLAAWALLRALPDGRPQARYVAAVGTLMVMAACPMLTLWAVWPGADGAVVTTGNGLRGNPVAVVAPSVQSMPVEWSVWVVVAWMAGVAAFSVRAAGGWLVAWRRQRKDRRALPDHWSETVARLAENAGVNRAVRWFMSARVDSPQVFGWWKPVVLIPLSAMTAMPASHLEALLAHELAHIRRHDFLVNCFQVAVETLLFYHPAVWWLSGKIREEREACCDRMAAEWCGDRALYGRALLTLEETRERFALAASGPNLAGRIRRLLGRGEGPKPGWMLVGLCVAAILLLAGPARIVWAETAAPPPPPPPPAPAVSAVPAVPATPPTPPPPPPAAEPRSAPTPDWAGELKRLESDDLIQARKKYERVKAQADLAEKQWNLGVIERAELLAAQEQLLKAQNRMKEMELRMRNLQELQARETIAKGGVAGGVTGGVPGGVQGGVLSDGKLAVFEGETHRYVSQGEVSATERERRVRYADKKFAYGTIPGSQMDRGKIYIQFGPPDEIESHPADKYEEWLYRDAGIRILRFEGAEFKLKGEWPKQR
jgi:beta-lactamase regulating signal transducer with metallopeptidase domain